jgi:hypothetical protein
VGWSRNASAGLAVTLDVGANILAREARMMADADGRQLAAVDQPIQRLLRDL